MDRPDSAVETRAERETRRLDRVRRDVVADPVLRRATLAGVGWLLLYAAATVATAAHPVARRFLGDVVYVVPVALAAVLSLLVARGAVGRRRRFWWLLVASNGLWLGGDLIWAGYAYLGRDGAPFPSAADVLYLCSYLLVPAAILVGFGAAGGRRRARGVLDAAVVGLGLGAVGWSALIAPQVGGVITAATVTGAAYPLLGVVIVITIVSVGLAGHRRVAPSVWLVGIAFTVSALTDAGYTWSASLHEYVSGDWLNLGWQLEAVVLCLAALCALRHQEGDGQVAALGRDLTMAPVLIGVGGALALAGVDAVRDGVGVAMLVVAGGAVTGLVARFLLSVADTRLVASRLDAALREQERLAVTDALTGLYNRRFFEEVLRLEVDRTLRSGGRLALLVADLDLFKRVNDEHGHRNGDAVLVEAAARFGRALRDSDVLARYGGEEFVMILPGADGEAALEVAERCRRTLSEQSVRLYGGTHLTLTASIGLACLPGDAGDADGLVRSADRAMYDAKESGRDRVLAAARDEPARWAPGTPLPPALGPLVRLADLVDARMGSVEHSVAMARWAGVLADALGLDATTRERAIQGSRLHDLGKVAIPDSLLTKATPLSEPEWQLLRTHPVEGARLVADLPGQAALAALVRGHHEHYDGSGYPDGLTAPDLSIEIRVIAVLDAWAAMRADRPYAAARTVADARAQLVAGRGSHFDPRVVDVFLELQAAGLVGQLRPLAPAPASVPAPRLVPAAAR